MRLAQAFMRCVLTGALVLSARAATADIITWDWSVFGATNPAGDASAYGNSRSLTVGGITVTATGWGYTHDSVTYGTDSAFENAGLGAYSGGLGVCNQAEDPSPPPTACASPAHAVGNNGAANPDDFVLFLFTDAVTAAPVTIDPRSVYISAFGDTDVSYWLGTVSGPVDLTGYRHDTSANIASLGFTNPRIDEPGPTNVSRFVYIPPPGGVGGTLANAILFGAQVGMTDDYFKIKSITADTVGPPPPVPEPLTVALLALGTAGLATYRRRMAARS